LKSKNGYGIDVDRQPFLLEIIMIEWIIKGREFVNCNCVYGCPCQFNALPSDGTCKAAIGFQFTEGHFGDVDLGDLRAAAIYEWPGAVHEGNGTMQLIVDESAGEAQRAALLQIMQGEETEPMATMWSVFTTMCSTVLEPLFKPIELEIDVESRTGRVVVPGVFEMNGEPIRNPVTNNIHRARINLPNGFEYEIAEIGSGTTKATGAIKLDLQNSHGQFAHLHLSNSGVVRKAA
jgi:hypothetical protein